MAACAFVKVTRLVRRQPLIRTPRILNEGEIEYKEWKVSDSDIVEAVRDNGFNQRYMSECERIAKQEQIHKVLRAKRWQRCRIGNMPGWRLNESVSPDILDGNYFVIGSDGSLYLGTSHEGYRNVDEDLNEYDITLLINLAECISRSTSRNFVS
jgi:hypothetical protein